MPSNIIQWYPGHMAKTVRMMKESLPLVDAVIEILDARIPLSSRNPEISRLCGDKPRLVVFSKSTLASSEANKAWKQYFMNSGVACILCDFITGDGMNEIVPAIRTMLAEKLEHYEERGMSGKALRAMVVGIPNVGKSSFINKFCRAKKAKVENRPGVTVDRQWVKSPYGIELLDMPGVLWPKFDDKKVGENLAVTGAIKDTVLNIDEIAILLCNKLINIAPALLCKRYRLTPEELDGLPGYAVLELIGRKRGYLISGGEVDTDRTAGMLLDEFQSAKIGRISLEIPRERGL